MFGGYYGKFYACKWRTVEFDTAASELLGPSEAAWRCTRVVPVKLHRLMSTNPHEHKGRRTAAGLAMPFLKGLEQARALLFLDYL